VVSGVTQMLEPTKLTEFRKNVAAQNNRAIFEIPEILATLIGKTGAMARPIPSPPATVVQ